MRRRVHWDRADIVAQWWQRFHEESRRLGKHWEGCHNCTPEERDPNEPVDSHHVVSQADLKRIGRDRRWPKVRLLRVLTDPRNSMLVCARCHHQHTINFKPLRREALRPYAWDFARELGLVEKVRAEYPTTDPRERDANHMEPRRR